MPSAEARAVALQAAFGAGASAVRVALADADSEAEARLRASFARGDLATWGYGESYARRASRPDDLLPGARSVVCVALAYATPAPARREPLSGRISNYAWSGDYHREVRRVLDAVARALDAFAQAPVSAVACDVAPLAERAFAARAGLGWIGKHTNLIAPGLGSYVFLGEVVTTLELEADPPLAKTCGACRRCVDVCPTGALRGDYTIDARRCIADLTQRTDGIPRELRALIGDWVWGCDLCQEICPPTVRAGTRAGARFAPAEARDAFPDLIELLQLRSTTYRRRYRQRAVGWRGAAVLRRNAAVALGNALDRAAVPALERSLNEDAHPMVRGHAAWALGRIGSPRARDALAARLARESDAGVREELACALGAPALGSAPNERSPREAGNATNGRAGAT